MWLISADVYLRRSYILQRYVNLLDRDSRVGYTFCPGVGVRNGLETDTLDYSAHGKRDRIISEAKRNWIRARFYAGIGDEYYWRGNLALAWRFYLIGLRKEPWMFRVVAKGFFFYLGILATTCGKAFDFSVKTETVAGRARSSSRLRLIGAECQILKTKS